MQIVFWLAVAALAAIVVWNALEWERDGKWRPYHGRYMRRWIDGRFVCRPMSEDEEDDFVSRDAW